MRKAAVFLILILQAAVSQSQSTVPSTNLLEWNEFYKLTWEDFQGTRSAGAIGDAGTAVSIKAKPYLVQKKIKYDVYAYFNRQKSWAIDKSPELLEHEQLHFDIAELYARKIRKRISELSSRGVDDLDKYNDEIKRLLEESNAADIEYDLETLHGALPKKQREWETNIKKQLQELEDFKKEKKVIGRKADSRRRSG